MSPLRHGKLSNTHLLGQMPHRPETGLNLEVCRQTRLLGSNKEPSGNFCGGLMECLQFSCSYSMVCYSMLCCVVDKRLIHILIGFHCGYIQRHDKFGQHRGSSGACQDRGGTRHLVQRLAYFGPCKIDCKQKWSMVKSHSFQIVQNTTKNKNWKKTKTCEWCDVLEFINHNDSKFKTCFKQI